MAGLKKRKTFAQKHDSKTIQPKFGAEAKVSATIRKFQTASGPSARKAVPHPLPPNDPVSVLGAQPLTNIQETDENYTMSQNDYAVLCTEACTITLADSPLTATPVLIIADGGTVTVQGGENSIQGNLVTLYQGTAGLFSFSPASNTWSVIVGGVGGGPATFFGQMSCQEASGSQNLTPENAFIKINQYTTLQNASGVTIDIADNQIVIQQAGWYWTAISVSFTAQVNSQIIAALFINGSRHLNATALVTVYGGFMGSANDEFTIGDLNYYHIGDILDLRVAQTSSSGPPVVFGITNSNFTIFMISARPTP